MSCFSLWRSRRPEGRCEEIRGVCDLKKKNVCVWAVWKLKWAGKKSEWEPRCSFVEVYPWELVHQWKYNLLPEALEQGVRNKNNGYWRQSHVSAARCNTRPLQSGSHDNQGSRSGEWLVLCITAKGLVFPGVTEPQWIGATRDTYVRTKS